MSLLRGKVLSPHGLRLEGLLEGTAIDGGDWLEGLRAWRAPAAFPADLDISTRGNRFSILFAPRKDARGDDGSEAGIAGALADLLSCAPPGSIGSLTSSVRSTRTTPAASILTVYQVDDSGAVRTVQGSLGLAPPVPTLAGSAFERYLKAEVLPGPPQALRLARLPAYPRDPAALDAAAASAEGLHGMLALSALARGYIRCEWYDDSGRFLYGVDLRVRELATRETMTLALPAIAGAVSLRLLY